LWDVTDDVAIAQIAGEIYDNGGIVSAVCHGMCASQVNDAVSLMAISGPCGLLNTKTKDGNWLLKGKDVTGFTNDEEEAVKLTKEVPFSLEDRLKERGATFHAAANWQANVKVSHRVVTGQNPASATGVGEAIANLLQSR